MVSWRNCLLVVLLAIAVRFVAGWYMQSHVRAGSRFEFGDSDTYWDLARAIASGRPYDYAGMQVFRTPGYPLFLAAVLKVAGPEASPAWGRAASAVLGGATVAIVMFWGRWAFSSRAGFWAGLIVALYPGIVALGGVVLSEALFMPLMAIQLACWTRAWQASRSAALASAETPRPSRAKFSSPPELYWSAAAGAAAGLATLARPSWLLFTPLALVLERIGPWRAMGASRSGSRLPGGLVMLAALVAVMAPWWIRNAMVTGHFVPTTLQVGASLYDGLNPAADGSSEMSFACAYTAALEREDSLDPAPKRDSFEYRLDARLRADAWRWATEHQGQAVRLGFIKLGRIWNIWPNEASFCAWPVRLVVVCSFVPLALGGLMGAWRLARVGWPVALCWAPAVYISMLHVVFVGSMRYREPVMLGLIVLAAAWWTRSAEAGG